MRIDSAGSILINSTTTADTGGIKLYSSSGVNSLPAASGTTQGGGALRLRGGDNAVLDMGLNSTTTWIQATDKLNLSFEYTLALNPNGGPVLINTSTQGLSTNFRIQGPNEASTGFNTSFVSMGNSNGGYPVIGYNCAPTTTSGTFLRYVNDYASWIDFHAGGVRTFTSAGGTGNTTGTLGPYVSQGGTSWTSSSDRRLKDDVQEIAYGLDTVKALEPVSYVMNDRNVEKRELGFIAQDVEGVVDEVVSVADDGYYGLNYQGLIPVLTKAIQEQQATIEALTARIAALES